MRVKRKYQRRGRVWFPGWFVSVTGSRRTYVLHFSATGTFSRGNVSQRTYHASWAFRDATGSISQNYRRKRRTTSRLPSMQSQSLTYGSSIHCTIQPVTSQSLQFSSNIAPTSQSQSTATTHRGSRLQSTTRRSSILLRIRSQSTTHRSITLLRTRSQSTTHRSSTLLRIRSQSTTHRGSTLLRIRLQSTTHRSSTLLRIRSQSTTQKYRVPLL